MINKLHIKSIIILNRNNESRIKFKKNTRKSRPYR